MKPLFRPIVGVLLTLLLLASPLGASAQGWPTFDISVEADGCAIVIEVTSSNTSRDFGVNIYISDGDGNELYSDSYDGFLPVTFFVTLLQSYSGTAYAAYEVVDFTLGEVEIEVNCLAQQVQASAGAPCGLPLAGVGQGLLVRPTPLYWAPRQNAASDVILETKPDAKTYWVLGVDGTRSFYKILIACKAYWVPIDTLVPNPDNVWRSAPLPTRIVE